MNILMIERIIFERTCGAPRGCTRVGPSCLISRGSLRQVASTRLLCGYQRRLRQELRHPQQAVAADCEHRHEACAAIAAHAHLAHRPSVLTPSEGFLDALADTLAGQVAAVASRTCIDRRAAIAVDVLCHMWGD